MGSSSRFDMVSLSRSFESSRLRRPWTPWWWPGSGPACSPAGPRTWGSEEHTSELQSPCNLVCRLLLEKKKKRQTNTHPCVATPPPAEIFSQSRLVGPYALTLHSE